MAVKNKGIAPPDKETPVGRFRLLIGDTNFVDIPAEPGYGEYQMFSDDEIEIFIETNDSIEGAVASGYLQLATQAALEAKKVQDFDLKIDTVDRARELRLLAAEWKRKADAVAIDFFEGFDIGIERRGCWPELAAFPYGGKCADRPL